MQSVRNQQSIVSLRKGIRMAGIRKTGMESLDQKIEQAMQKVIKTKTAHEQAVDELQILLDKKKAL